MSVWSYVKDGQQQGPVETAELQGMISQGALAPDTLVWKNGMANWAAANTLPELSATGAPPPVPAPGNPVPAEGTPDTADVDKNKIMGILAYLGILFLIPLLAARQSRFAMYHTNQGLVLFIAWILLWVANGVLAHIPFLGWIVALLAAPLIGLGCFILMIMGIINAAKGVCKPLPLIGNRFTLIK